MDCVSTAGSMPEVVEASSASLYIGKKVFDANGKRICALPFCGGVHKANGFCNGHDKRYKKGQKLGPLQKRGRTICELPDCGRKHYADGLCRLHYDRKLKGNAFDAPVRNKYDKGQLCSFKGCNRPVKCDFLCDAHYQQKLRGGPLKPIKNKGKGPCLVVLCQRIAHAKDVCRRHYMREREHGIQYLRIVKKPCEGLCRVVACAETAVNVEGICKNHLSEWRVQYQIERLGRKRFDPGCEEEDCPEPHHAKGVCQKHYNARRPKRHKTDTKRDEKRAIA